MSAIPKQSSFFFATRPSNGTDSAVPSREPSAIMAKPPERTGNPRVVVIQPAEVDHDRPFSYRRFVQFLGPGFLMSIAYIDPGNLESDLQAGSRAGYSLGWVLLWATVMGFIVQMLAAKLGVATGRHLAEHCRQAYPRPARLLLWLMVELAIIGSDIQEVIGSAIALLLLSKGAIPLYAGVILTAAISFVLLYIERLGVRHLEAFFAVLIAIMALSFGGMFTMAGIPYREVLKGLVLPRLPSTQIVAAVGLLGAVIMPHNVFLHSALVKSRQLAVDTPGAKKEAVKYFGLESALALSVTLGINICVMAVFAKGFFGKEVAIGLENAGNFLSERFGPAMGLIWAIGLLAAGQSSTMTGTYTGQFVMSGFIDLHVTAWKRVLLTRSIALWPTLLVALFANSSSEMDVFNQALNVFQSIQLPFAMIPVLKLTSSQRVMGPLVNSRIHTVACWGIAAFIMSANMWLGHTQLHDALMDRHWYHKLMAWTGMAAYALFVIYLAIGPEASEALSKRIHRRLRPGRPPDEATAPLLGVESAAANAVAVDVGANEQPTRNPI